MDDTTKIVCARNNCTGCTACVSNCPANAITISDSLYAYNAEIDSARCINCKMCFKICPQNTAPILRTPIQWKQGWVKSAESRKFSSSGGFATSIAKSFIQKGGIVCTCVQEGESFQFALIDQVEGLRRATGSKYVKSNPQGSFVQIKKQLKSGENVLFIGLPCQVAGLLNYIGNKNIKGLYTIDLICHGTPSPRLLSFYLHEEFSKSVQDYSPLLFRKDTHFGLHEGERKLVKPRMQDKYTLAFLNGIDYTENCYTCNYATLDRVSDMTLGDSWGTEFVEEMKRGISLALCQSDKGIELLKMIDGNLFDVDLEKAVAANRQLSSPSPKPQKRDTFFKVLSSTDSFSRAIWTVYPKESIKNLVKRIFYILHVLT